MAKLKDSSKTFSERVPRIIGRDEEIELIKKYLKTGGNQFLYFWAQGGLGKTRLLEEVQRIVVEAGPGYYFSGILDLYHSDMHSNSDIEGANIASLDPDNKFFRTYREKRNVFELLRERGTEPQTLEARRRELRDFFVEEERELASKAYKVIICFDTVELLQYESSVVEELAGAVDTRVKTWILEVLPRLNNALVIFAGRPKTSTAPEGMAESETLDHHQKLLEDFRKSFGERFEAHELKRLTPDQVGELILEITGDNNFISDSQLPVVCNLTAGNPVFLHLIVDLIRVISPEPRRVYDLLDEYKHLAEVKEDDPELKKAQKVVEARLLDDLFNSGELSGYLQQIALMPKGVDINILVKVLGLTDGEAEKLLGNLKKLSFVKVHKSRVEALQKDEERIFFHDEFYRLLSPRVIGNMQKTERTLAQSLITIYYDDLIRNLFNQINDGNTEAKDRVGLRERMQMLQVERMYYLMVKNPRDGYQEYLQLTEYANRFRQIGFAMRLLDEFLHFYNDLARRVQFKNKGITHQQVIRESVQTWMERLHWWGEREQAVEFAEKVFLELPRFGIAPDQELGILANIIALWGRGRTMLYGFESEVVSKLLETLALMPDMKSCTSNQLLGLGRLMTSIGYAYRQGGLLEQAVEFNDQAIACFRQLGTHPEELVIVLNNQAYVVARQGNTSHGRSLAMEALRVNIINHTLYSAGLSRTILASIERMALEDLSEAEKWALEAKDIFEVQLSDSHGAVRAYLNLGGAWRKIAERDADRGRDLGEAITKLTAAINILKKAINQATAANLLSEIPGLNAELGKVNRSLGRLFTRKGSLALGIPYFRESERLFKEALTWEKWNIAERADITEDLAEVYFLMGDPNAAGKQLAVVWKLLGESCRLSPGKPSTISDIPNRYFLPLGKVERQKGEIAMSQKDYLQGLKHFTTAYAYFEHFSKTAVEKNKMTESLYGVFLCHLPISEQQNLMSELRSWMRPFKSEIGGVSVQEFLDDLGRLMGA